MLTVDFRDAERLVHLAVNMTAEEVLDLMDVVNERAYNISSLKGRYLPTDQDFLEAVRILMDSDMREGSVTVLHKLNSE